MPVLIVLDPCLHIRFCERHEAVETALLVPGQTFFFSPPAIAPAHSTFPDLVPVPEPNSTMPYDMASIARKLERGRPYLMVTIKGGRLDDPLNLEEMAGIFDELCRKGNIYNQGAVLLEEYLQNHPIPPLPYQLSGVRDTATTLAQSASVPTIPSERSADRPLLKWYSMGNVPVNPWGQTGLSHLLHQQMQELRGEMEKSRAPGGEMEKLRAHMEEERDKLRLAVEKLQLEMREMQRKWEDAAICRQIVINIETEFKVELLQVAMGAGVNVSDFMRPPGVWAKRKVAKTDWEAVMGIVSHAPSHQLDPVKWKWLGLRVGASPLEISRMEKKFRKTMKALKVFSQTGGHSTEIQGQPVMVGEALEDEDKRRTLAESLVRRLGCLRNEQGTRFLQLYNNPSPRSSTSFRIRRDKLLQT
ncbi:hypothetical protein HDU86_001812 [Geranomyces michiganensis]|nr:hypothetical protein HDU86_001812 [Geranomyces michiganensis]